MQSTITGRKYTQRISFSMLATLLLLTGCATTVTPIGEAKPVPKDRVFFQPPTPQESPARVVFVRDQGLLGGAAYQHLFINGKRAASLDIGEKFELNIDAGEYIFGVQPTDPFGTTAIYSIDQEIKSGRQYFYRILIDGNSFLSRIQKFAPDGMTY